MCVCVFLFALLWYVNITFIYIYIYVTCFNVHGVAFQISYVCCFIALCTVAFCFWAYGAGGFLVKTRLVLDIMSFGVILHGRAPAHILAYKWWSWRWKLRSLSRCNANETLSMCSPLFPSLSHSIYSTCSIMTCHVVYLKTGTRLVQSGWHRPLRCPARSSMYSI